MDKGIEVISYEKALESAMVRGFHYGGVFSMKDLDTPIYEANYIPPFYSKRKKKYTGNQVVFDSRDLYHNLGDDNQYPHFLLDLRSKSAFLSSATSTTAEVAEGLGLSVEGSFESDIAEFKKWLKGIKANQAFQSKLFQNLAFFNGCYIQMQFTSKVENKNGKLISNSGQLARLKILPYTHTRVGNQEDEEYYWYHRTGFRYEPKRYTQKFIKSKINDLRAIRGYEQDNPVPAINQITVFREDLKNEYFETKPDKINRLNYDTYVHFVKSESLFDDIYPRSVFETEAAFNALILDYFLPQFDVASMENGLSVAHIVTVPIQRPRSGDAEEQAKYEAEKKAIKQRLRGSIQGVDNTDNILILYSDPRVKQEPISIAAVPNNNNHETLTEKDERKERVLLGTFRIQHPGLIGFPSRSGKGLNNQSGTMSEADDQWYISYISKFRRLAEDFYNDILVPIWQVEQNKPTSDVRVSFPRNIRYKYAPTDAIMLRVMTTQQIWDYFQLGIYTEEKRKTLLRDLADRGMNAQVPLERPNTSIKE